MKTRKEKNNISLTSKELRQIEIAKKMPIVYDEDSPRLTKKCSKSLNIIRK